MYEKDDIERLGIRYSVIYKYNYVIDLCHINFEIVNENIRRWT